MRQKFILPIFLLLTSIANAQFTEQGQKLISGGIGFFQSNTTDDFDNNGYTTTESGNSSVNLALGKFCKKNVLTSITLNYYHGNYTYINNPLNTNQIKNFQNSIGLSYGKTWYTPIVNKVYFGIGGNIGPSYGWSKNYQTANDFYNKTQSYAISFHIVPILDYQLSKRFVAGLSPGNEFLTMAYTYEKSEANSQTGKTSGHRNSARLSSGFFSSPLSNINITFKYLLK